ncbi:MAG: hypothetical protein GY796_14825, partial [Chloroflexi bacterium]|nr:hypothetical protein [Chloroflexota bacterium]
NLLEAARVYWQLARIYYNLNEKKSAIYAGLQALNLAEQAGPSPLLARLYGGLSVLIGVIPIHPLAKLYQDRALETAQDTGHLHTLGFVLEATGIYYLGVGQWGKMQAQLERANEIFEQLGDRHQGLTSRFILAGVFYYQGEFTQSEELFEDIYTRADHSGAVLQKAWGLLGKGATMLRLGQDNEALNLLEAALSSLSDTARPTKIFSYGLLAVAYLRQERLQHAHQAADTAMRLIAQSSPTAVFAFDGYANVAEVYLRLWETTLTDDETPFNSLELGKLAHQSCQALRRFARTFPIARPKRYLYQGLYSWLVGNPRQAFSLWQKSLSHARNLKMRYDEGLAHYEIGRHMPVGDPVRQQYLDCAEEIFMQLRTPYELSQVEFDQYSIVAA